MSEYFEPQFDHHRPWEVEHSFNDVLAEQLRKAPYLLGSLLIHAALAFAFAGLEFLGRSVNEAPVLEVAAPEPPPEVVEEEEPEEEIIEEEIEEPVLQEAELEEAVEQETLEEIGDPNFTSDAPFDSDAWNSDVGLGGGAGGKYGRRGGRGGGKRGKGSPTEAAVKDALQWLADHQTPDDGYWDCDEFWLYDKYPDEPPSDGPGSPVNDVGCTGLSLLAFLGHGSTMSRGEYSQQVRDGVRWLKENQLDSGLFGDEVGNPTLYNHSIATMAMCEAYYFSNRSPLLAKNVKGAIKVIVNSRNPYNAWRYSLEPNGDNDSSITGWMVFALKTAEDGRIKVPKDVYEGADNWFTEMTNPANGRTGYSLAEGGKGSRPARKRIYLERFPPEKSEALTAVALLCRIFMYDSSNIKRWQQHENWETLKQQADLMMETLPEWDEEGGSIDLYYWYYATFALNQIGDPYWKTWKKAIEKAMLGSQRKDGNFKGSWDPQVAAWGHEGGRVYTTAIGALILEVYYRYAKILGGR
ncbi:MAG: hypothetical protein DWQ01_09655 [Planctomycetota bacterium]|nr:MAG: hypothetical protein DWQ01_09655 [Planctomycetota bacterium]